jgi:PAS domain S-box-containing protein
MKNPQQISAENTLAKMLELSPIGAYVIQKGKYVVANQALAEMFGYTSPNRIEGLTVERLHPMESHEFIRCRLNECLMGKHDVLVFQVTGLKQNGEHFEVSLRSTRITLKGMPAIITYATGNANSRTIACGDSVQARNNKSVAVLAKGIAHEFNNALTCMTCSLELLKLRYTHEDGIHKLVESMWKSVMRMHWNTEHLLAYAQDGFFSPDPIDMNNLIRTIIFSLRHRMRPNMDIHTDLEPNLAGIKADRTQMHMLLSSVLSNAVEAIDGGGVIKVTAANTFIDKHSFSRHANITPGHFLLISIVDDGKGMDPETLNMAFEPFFTTNTFGRGLGLAAAHGIAAKHGGMIKIESALGSGTKVCIYLPSLATSLPDAYGQQHEAQIDLEHNPNRGNGIAGGVCCPAAYPETSAIVLT